MNKNKATIWNAIQSIEKSHLAQTIEYTNIHHLGLVHALKKLDLHLEKYMPSLIAQAIQQFKGSIISEYLHEEKKGSKKNKTLTHLVQKTNHLLENPTFDAVKNYLAYAQKENYNLEYRAIFLSSSLILLNLIGIILSCISIVGLPLTAVFIASFVTDFLSLLKMAKKMNDKLNSQISFNTTMSIYALGDKLQSPFIHHVTSFDSKKNTDFTLKELDNYLDQVESRFYAFKANKIELQAYKKEQGIWHDTIAFELITLEKKIAELHEFNPNCSVIKTLDALKKQIKKEYENNKQEKKATSFDDLYLVLKKTNQLIDNPKKRTDYENLMKTIRTPLPVSSLVFLIPLAIGNTLLFFLTAITGLHANTVYYFNSLVLNFSKIIDLLKTTYKKIHHRAPSTMKAAMADLVKTIASKEVCADLEEYALIKKGQLNQQPNAHPVTLYSEQTHSEQAILERFYQLHNESNAIKKQEETFKQYKQMHGIYDDTIAEALIELDETYHQCLKNLPLDNPLIALLTNSMADLKENLIDEVNKKAAGSKRALSHKKILSVIKDTTWLLHDPQKNITPYLKKTKHLKGILPYFSLALSTVLIVGNLIGIGLSAASIVGLPITALFVISLFTQLLVTLSLIQDTKKISPQNKAFRLSKGMKHIANCLKKLHHHAADDCEPNKAPLNQPLASKVVDFKASKP